MVYVSMNVIELIAVQVMLGRIVVPLLQFLLPMLPRFLDECILIY